VKQLGIDPANVLQTIDVVANIPDGHGHISAWPFQYFVRWVPKSQPIEQVRERLQALVARTRNFNYLATDLGEGFSKGVIYTIEHLVSAKGDPDRVAGTLLGGSLFQRVEARDSRPDEGWPRKRILRVLLNWARRFHDCEWHWACTMVLPGPMTTTPVATLDHVVEAFAVEHARLLHRYMPVHVRLVTPNGDVVHPGPREEKMRRAMDEARDAEAKATEAERRRADAEKPGQPEEPKSAFETATERALRRLREMR
jgi:hypothetical protein